MYNIFNVCVYNVYKICVLHEYMKRLISFFPWAIIIVGLRLFVFLSLYPQIFRYIHYYYHYCKHKHIYYVHTYVRWCVVYVPRSTAVVVIRKYSSCSVVYNTHVGTQYIATMGVRPQVLSSSQLFYRFFFIFSPR